ASTRAPYLPPIGRPPLRMIDGPKSRYEPAVYGLERARLHYKPPWVAVLAEILLDEILAQCWQTPEHQDAAQLLVVRLQRLILTSGCALQTHEERPRPPNVTGLKRLIPTSECSL